MFNKSIFTLFSVIRVPFSGKFWAFFSARKSLFIFINRYFHELDVTYYSAIIKLTIITKVNAFISKNIWRFSLKGLKVWIFCFFCSMFWTQNLYSGSCNYFERSKKIKWIKNSYIMKVVRPILLKMADTENLFYFPLPKLLIITLSSIGHNFL